MLTSFLASRLFLVNEKKISSGELQPEEQYAKAGEGGSGA